MLNPNKISDEDNAYLQDKLFSAVFHNPSEFEGDAFYVTGQDWLLELGSMTKRFEALGKSVTVHPHVEQFIDLQTLAVTFTDNNYPLGRYWQRDITLYAGDRPWLIARTLVPEITLLDNNQQLIDLGTVPLGRYLFSHPKLTRKQLQIAKVLLAHESIPETLQLLLSNGKKMTGTLYLWARRSDLLINGHPLQLLELFLPDSPLQSINKD